MFCIYCGSPCEQQHKRCPSCGADIPDEAKEIAQVPSYSGFQSVSEVQQTTESWSNTGSLDYDGDQPEAYPGDYPEEEVPWSNESTGFQTSDQSYNYDDKSRIQGESEWITDTDSSSPSPPLNSYTENISHSTHSPEPKTVQRYPLQAYSLPSGNDPALLDEVGGFNMGAFCWGPLWAFFHGLPVWGIMALFLGPLSPLVNFILGFTGNRKAWENRPFRNLEHFRATQRIWAITGVLFLFIPTVLIIILFITYLYIELSERHLI